MAFIFIYITHKSQEEAEKISTSLLEQKLIACANIFPLKSAYWWQDKIEKGDECVSILKAPTHNWEKIKEEVKKIHSFEVPCITKIEVEANEEYEAWVNSETESAEVIQ